jgi:flagellar hook-length control protein FliK
MKLESAGNVIGFPDVAARNGHALKRKQGAESATEEQAKSGFLSLLRSNIEDAEQILSSLEPEETRTPADIEAAQRESLIDLPYFGTLLGAVATKMASASIDEAPRYRGGAVSDDSIQLIEIAREFIEFGEPASSEESALATAEFSLEEARRATANSLAAAQEKGAKPSPVQVLEVTQQQPEATAANSLFLPGEVKGAGPKVAAPGHSSDQKRDIVAGEQDDAAGTVVPFRGTARAETKAENKSFDQGSSEGSDEGNNTQVMPPAIQGDADVFANKVSDRTPSQQIADNIRSAMPAMQSQPVIGGEKTGTIRFKLHPEHLGEIEVNLKIRGDKLEVGIVMERGDSAAAVRDTQEDLRKGLLEQGLSLEMVKVSVDRSIRETSAGGQSDLLQQGNQQPARQDSQAGSSGGASYGRSGTQRNLAAGGEDGNGNTQQTADQPPPRNIRSGVFL